MLVNIQGRKMELTPPLKNYALEKVSVVNKYLDSNLRIHIVLSVDKFLKKAEVSVNGKGVHLHGFEESEDMYASIDKVMDKISSQARKFKDKLTDHSHDKADRIEEGEVLRDESPKIIKTDLLVAKPMSTEDAMEVLDGKKLQFLVFRSSPGEKVNVIYHRADGNFGLIET